MSDNVPITPGSGALVSTEEIATLNGGSVTAQQVQRVIVAKRTADGVGVDETCANSTITTVGDSTTSQTLHAGGSGFTARLFFNDSSARLYVKYGTTATSDDYSYYLDPGDAYFDDIYFGRVDGIWASDAGGKARITELKP